MAAQNSNQLTMVVIVAGLVFAGGVGFFLLGGTPVEQPQIVGSSPPVQVAPADPRPTPADPSVAPTPVPGQDAAPQPASSPRPVAPPNRMARDLERERIWAALRREQKLAPAAPGAAAPSEIDMAQLPVLNADYVRDAIREQLVPVALECYQSALEDDPKLGGSVITTFTIVGAEDIGGIVEDAAISDESTLDNVFLRDCMRESLMAVSFEPPEDGGRIEVTYPFLFEPE